MSRQSIDPKAMEGCLIGMISLVPALGLCLLLMGGIKHFVVDSWLIALGAGLLLAFPMWGLAHKWVTSRVRKGERKLRERAERGVLEDR